MFQKKASALCCSSVLRCMGCWHLKNLPFLRRERKCHYWSTNEINAVRVQVGTWGCVKQGTGVEGSGL